MTNVNPIIALLSQMGAAPNLGAIGPQTPGMGPGEVTGDSNPDPGMLAAPQQLAQILFGRPNLPGPMPGMPQQDSGQMGGMGPGQTPQAAPLPQSVPSSPNEDQPYDNVSKAIWSQVQDAIDQGGGNPVLGLYKKSLQERGLTGKKGMAKMFLADFFSGLAGRPLYTAGLQMQAKDQLAQMMNVLKMTQAEQSGDFKMNQLQQQLDLAHMRENGINDRFNRNIGSQEKRAADRLSLDRDIFDEKKSMDDRGMKLKELIANQTPEAALLRLAMLGPNGEFDSSDPFKYYDPMKKAQLDAIWAQYSKKNGGQSLGSKTATTETFNKDTGNFDQTHITTKIMAQPPDPNKMVDEVRKVMQGRVAEQSAANSVNIPGSAATTNNSPVPSVSSQPARKNGAAPIDPGWISDPKLLNVHGASEFSSVPAQVPEDQRVWDKAFGRNSDVLTGMSLATQQLVRAIANYDIEPFKGFSVSRDVVQRLQGLAKLYNPNFDVSDWMAKAAAVKSFSPGGKDYEAVKSLNTVTQHLAVLENAFKQLGNNRVEFENWLANHAATQLGMPGVHTFQEVAAAIGHEAERTFVGGVGSHAGIEQWQSGIPSYSSPESFGNAINGLYHLLGGRFQALNDGWQDAVKNSPNKIQQFMNGKISEETKKLFADHGVEIRDNPEAVATMQKQQAVEEELARLKQVRLAEKASGKKAAPRKDVSTPAPTTPQAASPVPANPQPEKKRRPLTDFEGK